MNEVTVSGEFYSMAVACLIQKRDLLKRELRVQTSPDLKAIFQDELEELEAVVRRQCPALIGE